ncbi:MAG: mechanosensitive ion channel family protein [Treponema sp.]|nr:mechanosensitive ion channel family protein [Treponema sp.]
MEEELSTAAVVSRNLAEEADSLFRLSELKEFLTPQNLLHFVVTIISLIILYVVYRIIKKVINKHSLKKATPNTKVLVNRLLSYVFYVLVLMFVLSAMGVNLSAVWGAAGIAGVALGFAAQTAISNVISGLFIVGDKSLKIGDYIDVGGTQGTVDTISLLSVKIHTADNQMVRIPSSTIINTNLVNYSHFPLRRLTITVPVSYEADMATVKSVIEKVPERCETVLKDPAPLIFYDGFGDAIELKLCVWINGSDLFKAKSEVYINIVKVLGEHNLSIPYNRLNVQIVDGSSVK